MKLFLIVVLLCYSFNLRAQVPEVRVVGSVSPKYVSVFQMLKITVLENKFLVNVDAGGSFSFLIPPGDYNLQVTLGERILETLQVKVGDISPQNLGQLNIPFHEVIEEVVVTGLHKQESIRNSVYQVRVINNERIQLRAPNNVQEILSTELGFRFSNDLTLGTSDVQLMGMSGRNVKILLDGVPMVDRSDTRESLNQIDVNSIERIEIVEGPMSVVYGSDALAGVINIITKKPGLANLSIQARLQEETVGSEYEALGGKGKHNKSLSVNWQKQAFQVSAGISSNDFGGWKVGPSTDTELPTGQWLPKDQLLMNARLGYQTPQLNIWYRVDKVDELIDSKGPMNPNNYKAKFAEYDTDRLAHQLQSSWNIMPKLSLSALVGYTDLSRATRTVIHDFVNNTDELSTGQGEQDLAKFNAAIFRTTLQYQILENLSLQPGFEMNRDAGSGARIKGNPAINDYSFFLSAEWKPLSDLSVKPGFRTIKNSIYDAPPFIPSLNVKYNITENLNFRFGYAKGYRAPALRELYFDFFDASHSIMGNEHLKAERSNSWTGSFVFSQHRAHVQWSSTLSGFYNRFTDRIDYGVSAQDASLTTLINIGLYKTTGGSLENRLDVGNLTMNLGISHIGRYNRLVETTSTLGELPEFTWATEINSNVIYRMPKWKADMNLSFKHAGALPSYELYTENGNSVARQVKTDSYNLADLTVSKKIKNSIVLTAGVKNILDVTTLTNTRVGSGSAHGGGSGSGIPLSYGRSFLLGIQYNLIKNN